MSESSPKTSPRKCKSTAAAAVGVEESSGRDKVKLNDVISSAKLNFLNSTQQRVNKSPLKRPSTPSPHKSKHIIECLLSPASLKKAGLGSPPKKKPKLWKSKWQLATLSGGVTDTGKKKRASEASRLLDDEGVGQMLNRVPSVYGEVPVVEGTSNPRIRRARAATKPKPSPPSRPTQPKADKMKIKAEPAESPNVTKKVKIQESPPKSEIKDIKVEPGVLSPRRATRDISSTLHAELKQNLQSVQSEDYFTYLRELPSEMLETVLNCDIRYSLPGQGLPTTVLTFPSKLNLNKPTSANNQTKPLSQPKLPLAAVDRAKAPAERSKAPLVTGERSKPSSDVSRTLAVNPEDRLKDLREILLNDKPPTPVRSPGAFSEIYVRLFDSFAQVTIAPKKTKLSGSLSPTTIEEIIQLLNFVASTRMYKAVILTGLGSVFCQGVDLMYLCSDSPETRKQLANQLAEAVERLILALVGFPKVLVAAVNGSATGLGLALLPLCDVVYAAEKSTFNSHSARLGYIPEGGASISLPTSTNSALKELFLFGRQLTATQLLEIGLVSEVFLSGRLMEETIPRVRKGCNMGNQGVQCNKIILNHHLKSQLTQFLPAETRLLSEVWSSRDFYKTLVAFVSEKESGLVFQKPS